MRDFNDLQGSGRLAGDAGRQHGVLSSSLARLGGKDRVAAEGRAAELRAANDVVQGGDLAPNSGVGMNLESGKPVDLGNGTVVDIGPASEGDLAYQTGDGKVHLDEVKKNASALKNKLRDHPQQLDNMVSWRDADPDNRQVGCRIDSDKDWHKLFDRLHRDRDEMAIDRLIDRNVPIRIGDRDLNPDQLKTLRQATRDAANDDRHRMKPGKQPEWFETHMPNLDRASTFLKPYGVDFL